MKIENNRSSNGTIHDVASACNTVIAQRTNIPGGTEHNKSMERLVTILTTKPNALDTFKSLQKSE